MGSLRLLLAISVIAFHTSALLGTTLLPGDFAVETFFMISGFYMCLILSEKYVGEGAAWKFYTNRYLRLFPSYFALLIATLFWYFFVWWWLKRPPGATSSELYAQLPGIAKVGIAFANWSLIGLDIPSLFHYSPDRGFLFFHHYGTTPAPDGAIWAGNFRTVGHAWSVGLEIWFYLIAPWLVRLKSRWLVVIAGASAGLKIVMEQKGLMTYFFFPPQLVFFVLGMLAMRIWRGHRTKLDGTKWGWGSLIVIILFTVLFPFLKIPGQRWIFYTLVAGSLPLIFGATRKVGWDRWIGNLSYPLYLVHILVLSVVSALIKNREHAHATLVGSLLVAIALVKWIETPLDEWRQRRAAGGGGASV